MTPPEGPTRIPGAAQTGRSRQPGNPGKRNCIPRFLPFSLRFNRLELAGALGDLVTLLSIAIGMVLICGIDPTGLFFSIGVFCLFAGLKSPPAT